MGSRVEEKKTGPGKVVMLGRMLQRQRWQKIDGLAADDVDKTIPTPPPRRGNLHYRLAGVKLWTPRWAALQTGHLLLFQSKTDTQPEYSIQLGKTALEFEKNRQKVDVELDSGVLHHLNFAGTSETDFEGWLLSFYLHRVFAQAEFLRGLSDKQDGAAPSAAAPVNPILNPAIQSSITSVTSQFRRAKHSFIKIRANKKTKTKKNKSWRIFRKSKSVKTLPEAEPDELEGLMTKLEGLIADIGRLSTLLETEGSRPPVTTVSAPSMATTTNGDSGNRSITAPTQKQPVEKAHAPPPPANQPLPFLLVKTHSVTDFDSPSISRSHSCKSTTTLDGESDLDVDSEKEEEKNPETPMEMAKAEEIPPKVVVEQVKAKELPKAKKEEAVRAEKKEVAKKKERRRVLPAVMPPTLPITVGVVVRALKENSLPLRLFEPIGALQRMVETLEYAEILNRAMNEPEPAARMGLVAGFVVAGLASSYKRTGKPFNPLLGETYAMDRWDDLGWRFYAEQVSHNPDISACCVEGKSGWRLCGVLQIGRPKLNFTYISVTPTGVFHLYLYGKIGETYRYQPVECRVQNPVSMTTRCLHHNGTVNISCSNGYKTALKFESGSLEVAGEVKKGSVSVGSVEGQWPESVRYRAGGSSGRVVFSANPLPADQAQYYGFSYFMRELNELGLDSRLPPTDSRFRPDQRAFEEGRLTEAQRLKELLEENQRKRRLAGNNIPLRWFAPSNPSDFLTWTPNRRYWEASASSFKDLAFRDMFATQPQP